MREHDDVPVSFIFEVQEYAIRYNHKNEHYIFYVVHRKYRLGMLKKS